MLVSIAVHGVVVGAILVGTVMVVTAPVPELPTMMAFVASPPPPPPPPPPSAPAPKKTEPVKALPTSGDVAPIEPPQAIEPEAPYRTSAKGRSLASKAAYRAEYLEESSARCCSSPRRLHRHRLPRNLGSRYAPEVRSRSRRSYTAWNRCTRCWR